jgi:hypothetical protein
MHLQKYYLPTKFVLLLPSLIKLIIPLLLSIFESNGFNYLSNKDFLSIFIYLLSFNFREKPFTNLTEEGNGTSDHPWHGSNTILAKHLVKLMEDEHPKMSIKLERER